MSFEEILDKFSPGYRVRLIASPVSPSGPMTTTHFRYPEFAEAVTIIEALHPDGIYLMTWFDTAQLADGNGMMFFLRYRGIT